uniref:Signal peptidase I n=1 Tax=Solibacter usitatus (strain Ellin6076) TaxID=234267 RepID=Q025X2_SOLUE
MTDVETSTDLKAPGFRTRIAELTDDVQRGFIAEWAVTIILLLFGTTTLIQAFVIPSASMVGTLLIGDHVLVDKLVYAPGGAVSSKILPYRDVRRGDIIVFRYPLNISQDYVKRAIGVPGDHIHFDNKQLFLNGKMVNEPYTVHSQQYPDVYRDNFPSGAHAMPLRPRAAEMIEKNVVDGELVVPPGYIFAMGDNRDDSDDSRYWGLVPRENIVGTPVIIYWSFEAPTQDLINGNVGVDHIIDVITHFFTKTRWSRTFKLIRGYPLGRASN